MSIIYVRYCAKGFITVHIEATFWQGRFYYSLLTEEETETQEFFKIQSQYLAHQPWVQIPAESPFQDPTGVMLTGPCSPGWLVFQSLPWYNWQIGHRETISQI